MPHQGWHANISFAGPAAELVCEVVSTMKEVRDRVQRKNFIGTISSCGDNRLACPVMPA
jgi:hypothetical protein